MNAKIHFILRIFTVLIFNIFALLPVCPAEAAQIPTFETPAEAEIENAIDFETFPYAEYEKLQQLEEYSECKKWANEVGRLLKCTIFYLETAPAKAHENLVLLEQRLSEEPASSEASESVVAQSVAKTLKSRIVLWKQVLFLLEQPAAESYGTVPQKRVEDALLLRQKTEALRNVFLTSQNGQHWVQFFQLTPLQGHLGQVLTARQQLAQPAEKYAGEYSAQSRFSEESLALPATFLTDEENRRVSIMVNNIFMLKERVSLTPEQQQLLELPLIRDWLYEMEAWRANPLHPLDLLAAYESYKQYGGTSDGSRLALMTRQMIGSKDTNLQHLGDVLQNEYSQAHFKVYISKYLINTMLPKLEPEIGAIRENVAGQEVVGRRRADTQLHVTLVPDPNRLLMQLNINGKVVSQTTATTFPATLHNQTHGTYSATKPLELTSRGLVVQPANVTANSSVRLRDVETDLDIVPVVSGLIREIAKEQYNSQYPQIQADAQAKVLAQAKQRIDSETDLRFKQLNEKIDANFFNILKQRQASFEQYQAKTTEEWLLTSWYLSTPCSLGSDSKEPTTPQGAIADMKVHESGINAALERFDLAGKQMTLREMKQYLLSVIGQSGLEIPAEENDDVVIGFADINPVGVRLAQNRVELSLNLKCLQVEDRQWQDFCVIVDYVPDITETGHSRLVRQGTVQLDGRMSLLEQVGLRTIFSKIFLQVDAVPLRPKLFDNNEQFAGLNTGAVRIENGWFAIALFPQQTPSENVGTQAFAATSTRPQHSQANYQPVRQSVRQQTQPQNSPKARPVIVQGTSVGSSVQR